MDVSELAGLANGGHVAPYKISRNLQPQGEPAFHGLIAYVKVGFDTLNWLPGDHGTHWFELTGGPCSNPV